jgi:hypothetical protein
VQGRQVLVADFLLAAAGTLGGLPSASGGPSSVIDGAGGMIIGLAGIGAASGYGSGSGRRPGLKTGSG